MADNARDRTSLTSISQYADMLDTRYSKAYDVYVPVSRGMWPNIKSYFTPRSDQ